MSARASPADPPGVIACVGCGALVPDIDGPTHRYVGAPPGCWELFGRLGVRETNDLGIPGPARLSVHAYMAQHPGVPGPQSSQSVQLHLLALCLVLERGWPVPSVVGAIARILEGERGFSWLKPPPSIGSLTILDVLEAPAHGYEAAVRGWAEATWAAWSPHHATIRALAERVA